MTHTDVDGLKERFEDLKEYSKARFDAQDRELQTLKDSLKSVNADIAELKIDMAAVKEGIDNMKSILNWIRWLIVIGIGVIGLVGVFK